MPVDGGCDAPNAGVVAPNNPLGAAGGAGASLLENNEGPLVVDGVNWNGLLGTEGSLGFFSSSPFAWVGLNASADGAAAPEKRLEDWNGFLAGASAGLAGDAPPNKLEDAVGGVVVVAELGGVVVPKSEGGAAPDCSAGFAPKSGFEGDCPAAGAAVLAGLNGLLPPKPPKLGGGVKAFPLLKMEGFDAAFPFASGEVCMESSPPPKGDVGFCGLVWPNMLVEGAGLGAGDPNIPVVGVGPEDGAAVVVLPNRPPEGRGC